MRRQKQDVGRETDVLEVHLEEWGQHSWVTAMINTVSGSYGSAQYRFVARPPGTDHGAADHRFVGATFPMLRFDDLDDITEPHAWLDLARERLHELDQELAADGWQRSPAHGAHWWSLSYTRAA